MKKSFKILVLIVSSVCLSGCSLGFLASKQQAVTFQKDSTVSVLINKKSPVVQDGKYLLERDGNPIQIDIIKEGYLPETKVIYPHQMSGLGWAGIAMNAAAGVVIAQIIANSIGDEMTEGSDVLLVMGGLWFGSSAGLFGYHFSPRVKNYENVVDLKTPNLKIFKRDSTMKEVFLNKSSFDITPDNLKYQLTSIKDYSKGKDKFKKSDNIKKNLKIENSIFTDEINRILKTNGFVDTSGLVLRGGYRQNVFINTTVNEMNFTRVMCNQKASLYSVNYLEDLFNCFSTISIKTKWDLLDIYKNVIYSDTLILKSSEILEVGSLSDEDLLKKHVSDAMEKGLYTFMNSPKFKQELCATNPEIIHESTNIEIGKPVRFVSSLEEAVAASLTVKSKQGHGSGFLISENGYVVTNYHVVADSTNLQVILNDGSTYSARVLNVNKTADLALLKIEKSGLIPFNILAVNMPDIGEDVFAIGTREAEDLSQTISKGIISSIRSQSNGSKIIQTDAKVNSGNSGGPLVDGKGNILGIVNAKLKGVGIEGIGFSIPSEMIVPALNIDFK